jgi:hypothetical protein
MNLREIGWVDMDWIELAQDRTRGDRYPVGKFLSSCTTGGFSRRARLHRVSSLVRYVVSVVLT